MTKEQGGGQGKHFLQIKYLGAIPVARQRWLAHNSTTMDASTPSRTAPYPIAVIMERVRLANRWATERWEAKGVVRDDTPSGSRERVIVSGEHTTQMLFPGFVLKLHPDEAEGYIYNITSPQPKVFIMWRMKDDIARPESLTVSYHEGARWMDAEETVGGVALPPDLLPWIAEYAAEHYKPEPKKKVRYASSKDKGVASRRGGDA
ncbi:MAG TPA: DUF3305 domain-containing protein [Burkholderiales bacterium]|jgi:hypothetical protein|nr:DUF3305 domain-containing protein [Burkholderiales bacterium]